MTRSSGNGEKLRREQQTSLVRGAKNVSGFKEVVQQTFVQHVQPTIKNTTATRSVRHPRGRQSALVDTTYHISLQSHSQTAPSDLFCCHSSSSHELNFEHGCSRSSMSSTAAHHINSTKSDIRLEHGCSHSSISSTVARPIHFTKTVELKRNSSATSDCPADAMVCGRWWMNCIMHVNMCQIHTPVRIHLPAVYNNLIRVRVTQTNYHVQAIPSLCLVPIIPSQLQVGKMSLNRHLVHPVSRMV